MAKRKQPDQRKARVKTGSGQVPNPAQKDSSDLTNHRQ